MRLVGTALALIVALLSVPAAADAGSDTLVACAFHGQLVLQSRADCLRAGGQPSTGEGHETDGAASALDPELAQGMMVRSVFACRAAQALASVISMAPGTRWMLAQALVRAGDCTRIDRNTTFAVLERRAGALRVRVPTLGSLWVSEWVEIPDVDRLQLTGYTLKPEPGEGSAPSGIPLEEQPKGQQEPPRNERAPVAKSDDGHTRTCNCGGSLRITAQRDCREACGVSFRTAVHDSCDRQGCYWHGELMSRQEMADHETNEEGME